MKRIIIFIGLKVGEVTGLGVGILGLVYLAKWVDSWLDPLYTYAFVFLFLLIMACYGIYLAIKANWRKAGEIAGRGKG